MKGGKREGAGRRQGSVKESGRTVVRQLRWTEAEWALVEAGAEAVRENVSEYQRKATLERVASEKAKE